MDDEENFCLEIELNENLINNLQIDENDEQYSDLDNGNKDEDERSNENEDDDEVEDGGMRNLNLHNELKFEVEEKQESIEASMEISMVNKAMLKLLQIKKKSNLANVHNDEILKVLFESDMIKEELQSELPYSTEEVYRNLGLKSRIGEFKLYKVCSFRCKVFEKPKNEESYCSVCQTSRLGYDTDLEYYCRPIKSIFLRYWKKKKFRDCFIRNNPKPFVINDDTLITSFNSAKL